jgi:hypothetical protein
MDSEPAPQVSAPSDNIADLQDINDRPAKRVKMEEASEKPGFKNSVSKDEDKPKGDDRDTKKSQAPIKAE